MNRHSILESCAALRCGLTGQPMTDPVIVWTSSHPRSVRVGVSYERLALEQWLRERGDCETRYGPNTALKELGRLCLSGSMSGE
jgi:hypothetical protein